jgi:hypothetical protein
MDMIVGRLQSPIEQQVVTDGATKVAPTLATNLSG